MTLTNISTQRQEIRNSVATSGKNFHRTTRHQCFQSLTLVLYSYTHQQKQKCVKTSFCKAKDKQLLWFLLGRKLSVTVQYQNTLRKMREAGHLISVPFLTVPVACVIPGIWLTPLPVFSHSLLTAHAYKSEETFKWWDRLYRTVSFLPFHSDGCTCYTATLGIFDRTQLQVLTAIQPTALSSTSANGQPCHNSDWLLIQIGY